MKTNNADLQALVIACIEQDYTFAMISKEIRQELQCALLPSIVQAKVLLRAIIQTTFNEELLHRAHVLLAEANKLYGGSE